MYEGVNWIGINGGYCGHSNDLSYYKKIQGISQLAVLYFERTVTMRGGQYGHGE